MSYQWSTVSSLIAFGHDVQKVTDTQTGGIIWEKHKQEFTVTFNPGELKFTDVTGKIFSFYGIFDDPSLSSQTVQYGDIPIIPTFHPNSAEKFRYHITQSQWRDRYICFGGFDKTIDSVTSDVSYTAQWGIGIGIISKTYRGSGIYIEDKSVGQVFINNKSPTYGQPEIIYLGNNPMSDYNKEFQCNIEAVPLSDNIFEKWNISQGSTEPITYSFDPSPTSPSCSLIASSDSVGEDIKLGGYFTGSSSGGDIIEKRSESGYIFKHDSQAIIWANMEVERLRKTSYAINPSVMSPTVNTSGKWNGRVRYYVVTNS